MSACDIAVGRDTNSRGPGSSDTPQRLHLEAELTEARVLEASRQPHTGHIVEVTLIRAGTSSNGNHYPDETLRAIASLFEGAKAYADHQEAGKAGQPRSVRDLVGYYRNTRYELTPQGGRIRADFHLLPGQDWLWNIIQEAASFPAICGLSIDALGEVKMTEVGGRQVRLVKGLRKVNSVDVVSKPAAGGTLDRILAGEQEDAGLAETGAPDGNGPILNTASDGNATHAAGGRPRMEETDQGADPYDAAQRKQFATVVRHHANGRTEYKFPIPPKGHPAAKAHAEAALARLDQSDLSPSEKAAVRGKAESVLKEQETTMTQEVLTNPGTDVTPGWNPGQGAGTPTHSTAATGGQSAVPASGAASLQEGTGAGAGTPAPPLDLAAELQKLQEANAAKDKELARIKEALAPSGPQPSDPNADAVQLLEQIKRDRDVEKCARLLESQLSASLLPSPIQDRLRKRYENRVFDANQLLEDLSDEREVLAKLSTSGQVIGHGYEKRIDVGMNEYEQIQAAFDKMFDVAESEQSKAVPSFSGIRDAFAAATGRDITSIGGCDLPLREAFQDGLRHYVRAAMESGRLTEAEFLLREADVTTSSFSFLLGTSMNKRLLKDYQAWPSEWQKFVNTVAIKDFKQQDRIRLGAFGSLSTVNEDAAYTTLTLADTHATYTPTKRGNLVQISRETIINDDLYAIKQIPQKLAVAAAYTLAEFIYQLLDPSGGNIYDAHKLFDATNHGNTGVTSGNIGTANSGTALSSAAMQTAVIGMRKQQNAASKPIGLKPRFLLVPPDLEFTAMTILKSAGLPGGANNDINPMMGYAEPIVAPQVNSFTNLGATTTFACVIADPRVIDTIEVGFVGGQVNPVLFIQDQPLYGINFTQDVISYKVRHEYGGSVVDYRGFYLINN